MAPQNYHTVPTNDPDGIQEVDAEGGAPPPYYGGNNPEAGDDDGFLKRPICDSPPEAQLSFVRRVYLILSVQLLVTAVMSVVAMFCQPYKEWILSHTWTIWISMAVCMGSILVNAISDFEWKGKLVNLTFLTLGIGYITSFATATSQTSAVALALFMTLTVFFGLTLFTIISKIDFSSWAPYLFIGLLLLTLGGVVSLFFPYSSTRELIFGIIGTIIFSGYILVDTFFIMTRAKPGEEVDAALSLYLDIINLFLSILRILNSQSSRD